MSTIIRISEEYQRGMSSLAEFLKTNADKFRKRMAENELTSFTNRRGSMVLDVVSSRQRKYEQRVIPMVQKWEVFAEGSTLEKMVDKGCPAKIFGLRTGEEETIVQIASNFLEYGKLNGISDENVICSKWAEEVEDMRFAYDLDPVVGGVKGIGLALFNYMRMLSGSDTIKPDVRVKKKLEELGFKVPKSDISIMFLCESIAKDLGISMVELDQLLWFDFNQVEYDDGAGMLFFTKESQSWKTIDKLKKE